MNSYESSYQSNFGDPGSLPTAPFLGWPSSVRRSVQFESNAVFIVHSGIVISDADHSWT
jgi:hypothetical protein